MPRVMTMVKQLQSDDEVDDAVAGAVARMRLLKGVGQDAVFRDAVEHAVGADDRSILRAGENQDPDQHDEAVEDEPRPERTPEVHGDAADQVAEIFRADFVGNNHHREEGSQSGEEKRINADNHRCLLQVLQLGVGDFAVDLGQCFFAAHGEHRMSESDEHDEQGEVAEPGVLEGGQPAQRFVVQGDAVLQRIGWNLERSVKEGDGAPQDQNDHHDGGDHHDLDRFGRGLVHALSVLPPEINGDQDAEDRGKGVVVEIMKRVVEIDCGVLNEAGEVLSGDHGAERAGQDVIEEKRGDRELGEGSAHGPPHHAVNSAADEHAGGFDVERANAVREQHDREDEPGCALADDLLGVAANVVRGGAQVGEHDGRGTPERDEAQQHGGRYEDADGRTFWSVENGGHSTEKALNPYATILRYLCAANPSQT